MKGIIVIPARFASTRFPGKPLADIHGKPMIQWVYERARQAKRAERVIVATDDERIVAAVRAFGGEVVMTSSDLASGTDRVAAVAEKFPADYYVNVQGDEPLIAPGAIDACVDLLLDRGFEMSTVMAPLKNLADLNNPTVVKVLVDRNEHALYFSRYPIPYSRSEPVPGETFASRRHVGLYGYRYDTLLRLSKMAPSPLEMGESLEQLRALEAGISIGIREIDFLSVGVDVPEDLEKVRVILADPS